MEKHFGKTGKLIKSIIIRDRIRIPVWIISIVVFTVLIAAILPDLYTTETERHVMAESMKNPAITVMLGPGYGLDNYTDGAMMAHFMLVFTVLAAGIMSILLTTRHTREDEEEGRIEMIRSLPVGSLSTLAATFIILIMANIILALLTAIGLYSLGFESMDFQGSFLYGASIGAVGIFFAALTSLFAHLTTNSRATLGYSFVFLIASYIIRGIGDVGYEILSLISPLGLILRTQVFVNNYWWPVFVSLAISAIVFLLALYLNSIRDLGAGFIPERLGREYASPLLSSPLGLALRLQRTAIISWLLGILILGASYGSILGDLEGFIDSSGILQQMIPQAEGYGLTESFITMLITIMSIIGVIPPLIFILKLKSEENKGRTESLLAKAVSRNSLLGSYALISLILAPIVQLLSVVGLWSSAVLVMEDPISFSILLKAAFAHLPAMWIMIGLAIFLIGFIPRLTGLSWLYLGYSFFVVYMGEMLQLPEWMADLSAFAYVPQIPVEEINFLTLTVLTIISIVLIIGGFIGYNRRDIMG